MNNNSSRVLHYLKSPLTPALLVIVAMLVMALNASQKPQRVTQQPEAQIHLAQPNPSSEGKPSEVQPLSDEPKPTAVPPPKYPHPAGSPQHEVAVFIHRTFRISLVDARQITSWAVEIGERKNLDPLLILAIIGTESSFKPTARSKAGAEGLMQVMTSVHKEKFEVFGGREAAFDPYANMVVGSDILSYLIKRTGNVRRALKWYSGAARLPNDRGYSRRVFREHGLLKIAAMGNSDKAVQLHRAGKKSPHPMQVSTKHMSYAHWVKLSERARKKSSTKTLQSHSK